MGRLVRDDRVATVTKITTRYNQAEVERVQKYSTQVKVPLHY